MVIVVLPLGRTLRCELKGLLWDNIVSWVSMTSLLKKLGEAIANHYKNYKGVLPSKIRKKQGQQQYGGWMGLQSKLITIMNYRWLVKTTSKHIKGKHFKSFLFLFYRKNIEKTVTNQQMEGWQAILSEISRQQKLKHQPLGNKNRFDNCLINYKGFKLNLDKLSHITPQLLQQLLHIFMRIQINYIHTIDYLNEEKHFRLYSILEPKKVVFFKEYYTKMSPQQKLGEKTVLVPTIGNGQSYSMIK